MLGVGGWEKQSGLAGTALLTPDGTSGGSGNKWLLAPLGLCPPFLLEYVSAGHRGVRAYSV